MMLTLAFFQDLLYCDDMTDIFLASLVIFPSLETCIVIGNFEGNMVIDTHPPLSLATFGENDMSEKLLVKDSYGFENNMIVISKDIFVEEYPLNETSFVEPCIKKCVRL